MKALTLKLSQEKMLDHLKRDVTRARFAPTEDRDKKGEGFTHKVGDKVIISEKNLGNLVNYVNLSTECPEWTFGISDLYKNLSKRNLIS